MPILWSWRRFCVLLRPAFAAATCVVIYPSVTEAQAPGPTRWIATWTASMFQVPPVNVQRVAGRTMRQIARIALGGDRVRVRLSNEYGDRPLRIGSAQLALVDTGAVTIAGSSRPLTFGGRTSIVIRPGAVVVSDPVAGRFPSLASVAVSLFFPDTAYMSTLAVAGPQLSYTSEPGDHTAETAFPVTSVRAAWMTLAGIDVDNPRGRGAIVAFGSSLTGGAGATKPDHRWPDVFARRLLAAQDGAAMSVVVASINGNQLLSGGRTPPSLARFDRDVLGLPGVTDVIVFEGANDIAMAATNPYAPVTAADIIFGLTQLATRARDHGLRVFIGTLLPFEGSRYNSPPRSHGPEAEAMRQEVNGWIRGNTLFDGVIDFDACGRDPGHPTRVRPTYDSGDQLHLNDAGYLALGECVDLRLFRATRRR